MCSYRGRCFQIRLGRYLHRHNFDIVKNREIKSYAETLNVLKNVKTKDNSPLWHSHDFFCTLYYSRGRFYTAFHCLLYCSLLLCIIPQLMNRRIWNKVNLFVMKWLIQFYITEALGTVCKRTIMKSFFKICFWKSKIGIFFGKKTERWY